MTDKSNIVNFPTPREQAGVSMLDDMDMLLDALMDSMIALKHSENVAEEDREQDMEIVTNLFIKYIGVRADRYPTEEEE